MYVKIKVKTLETIKQYLLGSLLPSREVQEIVHLLKDVEEIKEENIINKTEKTVEKDN